MSRLRFVDIGVTAAIAVAAVTAVGLVQSVRADGGGTASSFVPIVPCRLADTRPAPNQVGGRGAPLAPGETATFAVWGTNGNCTIPASATAIASNVTAVNPTANGYLTVFPADAATTPLSANLNWTPTSPPTPNQVTVALSATGAIKTFNYAGTIDLVIDVVGYYVPSSSGPAGPPGPVGAPGPQGPPGPVGPRGSNAGSATVVMVTGDNYVAATPVFTATADALCLVTTTVQIDPLSALPAGVANMFVRNAIKRNGTFANDSVFGFYIIPNGTPDLQPMVTRASTIAIAAGDTVQFGAYVGNVADGAVGGTMLAQTGYICT